MKAITFSSFLARIDTADYRICRRLNRGASWSLVRRPFQLLSRLGNGVVWYVLIVALPFFYGAQALRPAIVMALTGVLGRRNLCSLEARVRARAAIHQACRNLAGRRTA
jgi:undecaprenyl-diphosphatase